MSVKNILSINFNEDDGSYQIAVREGSNVAEAMFATAAMIRCFVRDEIIDDENVALDMLRKYLGDPQYAEVVD